MYVIETKFYIERKCIKAKIDKLVGMEATPKRLKAFNELQRRLWIIEGFLDHKKEFEPLILTYLDHIKVDIVPKDYMYFHFFLK